MNTLGKAKASVLQLQLASFLSWESLLKPFNNLTYSYPTSRPIHDFDERVNQITSSDVVIDRHFGLRKGKSGKSWHLMTRRILTGPHRGADRPRRQRSPHLCGCLFQNCLGATKGLPDLTRDHDRIREASLLQQRLLWRTRFHWKFPRGRTLFHEYLWTWSCKVRRRGRKRVPAHLHSLLLHHRIDQISNKLTATPDLTFKHMKNKFSVNLI